MLIGYARVSTADQDLQLQLDALEAAGCTRVFTDRASGSKRDRAGLNDAIAFAREGDALVVWKLDRLGRSVKQLIDLAEQLQSKKVDLRSLTEGIDTSGAAGRFFFHLMASLAEMERGLIRERTRAGLAAARRAGRVGGRRPLLDAKKKAAALNLFAAGTLPKDVAKILGVSVPTLYRHIPAQAQAEAQVQMAKGADDAPAA